MNSLRGQTVKRWRTAIKRKGCSRPVKLALNDGMLGHGLSFFDYGCGHGEDLEFVADYGIDADGFDPHFFPDNPLRQADTVNLGYVINVIENPRERTKVLKEAFSLATNCLIVSTQSDSAKPQQLTPFKDGYFTRRGTFQKYYNKKGLYEFLKKVCKTEPYHAECCIYYLFKNNFTRDIYLLDKGKIFTNNKDKYALARYLLTRLQDGQNIHRAIQLSPLGKKLPNTLYAHSSALLYLPITLRYYIACGRVLIDKIDGDELIKVTPKNISFLSYRNFDDSPHPELISSHIIDTEKFQCSFRDYSRSDNPPILHRKETFVHRDYPHYEKFQRLTAYEEELGLLSRNDIGYRKKWQGLLATIPEYSVPAH